MSWSYSRINEFDCPRYYKFKRIDKLPTLSSPILEVGSLAHNIIEAYTNHLKEKNLTTDITTLPEIAESIFFAEPHPDGIMQEVMDLASKFGKGFIFNKDTFYGSELLLGIDEKGNQVEKGKTDWRDWDWGKVYFSGKIDRIDVEDNRILITDYKSGYNVEQDKRQLAIYAWLVHSIFPEMDTFQVQNHFVRFGYATPPEEITLAEIEKTKKWVAKKVKQIEAEKEFNPKPGPRCAYCGYIAKCGQMVELQKTGLPALNTPEKAVEWAGKILIVKEVVKRAEGILKEYCKEKGAVDLGTGAYGYNYSESLKVKDVEKFCEVLWEAEKNPYEFLNVDMRRAKKLIGKIGRLDSNGIVEMKGSTRFGFKKGAKK